MWDHLTIWNCIAFVIAAAGVGLLAWALFADRAKGHLRCPKCWYALDGTPADEGGFRKCSECGRGKLRERSLKKTRRRWRYALLALLVLVFADETRRIPAAQERGWVALVPTTLIIPLAPIQSERWVRELRHGRSPFIETWSWIEDLRDELFRRDDDEECWMWQANVWAYLAPFGVAGEGMAAESFDFSDFVERPIPVNYNFPGSFSSPTYTGLKREALDAVCGIVVPDGWEGYGGNEALASVIGSRLVVIGPAKTVTGCTRLVSALESPEANAQTIPMERFAVDGSGMGIRVLKFAPIQEDWNYSSPEVAASFVFTELYAHSTPDEWRHNGGEGIVAYYLPGRLVFHGRPELVAVAINNLDTIMAAAKKRVGE
jgi:hypothetical protein